MSRDGNRRIHAAALVAVVGWVCIGGPALDAWVQSEVAYSAAKLIGRWRAIMNNTLAESRAFASEEVADMMEVFVSPGAVRAVQDKLGDEQLKKADTIVERFALAAVGAAARRDDGSRIVDDTAVEAAEKAVCPVYPFCPE